MNDCTPSTLISYLRFKFPRIPYDVAIIATAQTKLSDNPITTAVKFIITNHPEALI